MKHLVAVIDKGEGKKGWWTRIGTAWENRDGSWSLRFDYFPCDLSNTNVQMRDPPQREGKPAETPAEQPKQAAGDDDIPF